MVISVSMVGRLPLTPLNGSTIPSMTLTMLDYNDPMSFFDVARRLEAVIVREEETETNHPA